MRNTAPSGYTRVQKKDVINKLREGKTVLVVPCNIRLDNPWGLTVQLTSEGLKAQGNSLENWYNYYTAMNCTNNEVGRYPAFYIQG